MFFTESLLIDDGGYRLSILLLMAVVNLARYCYFCILLIKAGL